MVEIREVGNNRFEVFAEDRHWEAFHGVDGAMQEATRLARQISTELNVSPDDVPVRHFRLV